ncbi:MAG TPA: alpha/beta hydrolase [Actinomycetota bacterium]|nr:alpha/beta hydrolase [Actinomycetota bacterium]
MIIRDDDGDVIRSFDGTLLATRSTGEGAALPLLVCNAVGANLAPWRKALVDVERDRTILSWDMRGLLGSGHPASDRLDPGAHAEDAVAVLDHYDADRVVLASWSNGSRVALELATRYPERVAALVIVCGGYGWSLRRTFRNLDLFAAVPTIAGVAKHFGASLQAPLRALVARPEMAGLIRQTGAVAATADTLLLLELLRGIAENDLSTLLATFEAVAGDPAPELGASVEAPALLVAGEKDPFTQIQLVAELAESIPDSRMLVYERATHYLPIEYPGRLSDDMRKFFAEVGV